MKIQRKFFFERVRDQLFEGHMTQDQVDGCNLFLDYFDKHNIDTRWGSYILSTVFHETARTMQPIEEYGKGQGKAYGQPDGPYNQKYYGRGYVQLTWYENYLKQDNKLKLDEELVKNPNLALDPQFALEICVRGMIDGDFTGHGLSDHIQIGDPENDECDFFNSRKIVNALDKADVLESYAYHFANAITHTPVSATV